MSVPYETATSGERARGEISKLLQRFGCETGRASFGCGSEPVADAEVDVMEQDLSLQDIG